MPRKKKRSILLDRAESRHAEMSAIDADLDFGEGLSVETFKEEIEQTRQALANYNRLISTLEQAALAFKDLERNLGLTTSRMLAAVAARYGKESAEYKMAGGTILSERNRPAPRPVPLPVVVPADPL
ncbi:MAG: hypothetical protein AAF766_04520 [Cyanobacteria bacterium P01_D01_bin.14]